jgi:hypothetical protein
MCAARDALSHEGIAHDSCSTLRNALLRAFSGEHPNAVATFL